MGVGLTGRQETACQDLLRSSDLVNGWLRQKTKLHKLGDAIDRRLKGNNFQNLSTLFSWERRFVVLKEGFAYFYSSETARKATKVLDLGAFKSVQVEQLKAKDVAWPFRIVNYVTTRDVFLGASSQDDQQHWMAALQKGIDAAVAAGRKMEPPEPPTTPASGQNSEDEDEYDTIPDMNPEEKGPKGKGGGGGGGDCTEYELVPSKEQTIRGRPVPPAPVENRSDSGGSGPPKTKPKPFPVKPKPPLDAKLSQTPPPISARIQPVPRVTPKTPLSPAREAEDDVDVEYELEENLYTQALWMGESDKGIQLLRSMKEEGVFMIRQSTTGNGDQTLQVTVKGEVKKYKLIKEGGSYRMADGKSFDDIMDLLIYYQSHNIPNYETKLRKPYKQVSKR